MEKRTFSIQGIVEIALLTAIAFALDYLQGGLWRGVFTNGGSIGLAMVPIVLICYRRGFAAGLISGVALSFLQLLGGWYTIASTWYNVFLQFALDYLLAYPVIFVAGFFASSFKKADTYKEKLMYLGIGTALGGFLKFLMHFLSGAIFFKNFDFPGGPVVYSIVYNGGYMLPNTIITFVVLAICLKKQPSIFEVKSRGEL